MSTEPSRMSRRAFLFAAAVTVAAVLPSSARLIGVGGQPSAAVEDVAVRLRGLLDDEAAAEALGHAYLAARSRWPSLEELVRDLVPVGSSVQASRQADAGELLAGVRDRRTSDYRAGRLTNYDGWLISDSEARLAALHVVA